MDVRDLTVEVRAADLSRIGQIDEDYLPGALFVPRFRGVGAWQVTLPASVDGQEYTLATELAQEGAGIIVTGPGGVILSGPMTAAVKRVDTETLEGEWVISGISDLTAAEDALAYPQPSNVNPATQNVSNDVRSGARETLLHAYVNANIGPAAPVARRKAGLVMGTNTGVGGSITQSPRFQNLLELLQQISIGSDLWFDIRQDDAQLRFVTGVCVDRTLDIRLDLDNQQLDSIENGIAAPTVTDVIVAGQGEGATRKIITRESATARAVWGRRIERFIDQRQTNETTELQEAGDAAIAEGGITIGALKIVPSEDIAGTYGVSWSVGDWVTAVIGDVEVPARVNAAAIAVRTEGVFVGVTIGDDVATDWESGVDSELTSHDARISNLERNTVGVLPQSPRTYYPTGSRYIRVARVNGGGASGGAHVLFDYFGGSNYGVLSRASGRAHFTQRGAGTGAVGLQVWNYGATTLRWFTKYTAEFNFELWLLLPSFASTITLRPGDVLFGELLFDSETTTAPSGLVEVTTGITNY
ncbi:Gp37-like protein [Microbacterium sp. PA5]|uniref:Gp37-like protein n=1 Tax=Microbacterium sp. PA5 TaxID=3416654 RepID=UPI003CE87336